MKFVVYVKIIIELTTSAYVELMKVDVFPDFFLVTYH